MPQYCLQDNVTRCGIWSSGVSSIMHEMSVSEPTDPRERLLEALTRYWAMPPSDLHVAVNGVIEVDTTSEELTADIYIGELPEPHTLDYELLMAIPVHFEAVEDAVIAHFREARLMMSGTDHEDATVGLLDWILDSFDDLESADPGTIGDDLENQMRVLRTYLRRRS